ncbi:MAG: hypothetical protein IKW67_02910 [Alphaproteobacteria bacterium]|nr:hypothetical protein [Alphaproteobacteria bacterium]
MADKSRVKEAGKFLKKVAEKPKNLREGIDVNKKELIELAKENFRQFGKLSGAALLLAVEYLLRGMNGVFVSNSLLAAMEKKFKGKKKNPVFTAYASYYFALMVAVAGADLTRDDSLIKGMFKEEEGNKTENVAEVTEKEVVKIEDFSINPNLSDEEWNKQINAIHPYVLAHLFLTEGFIEKTYSDNGSRGTSTFGVGFTIDDPSHKNFAEKHLGRKLTKKDTKVTLEEAKKLTDSWLRERIYPNMKKAFDVPIDARMFVSFVVTAYNAGENTFTIDGNSGAPVRDAVNAGMAKEDIADLYVRQYGKIRKTRWGGMSNKYAICATYMLGDISDKVILNCIGEAPYTIENALKNNSEYLQVYDEDTMEPGRLLIYDGKGKKALPCGLVRLDNIEDLLMLEQNRITHGTKQLPVCEYISPEDVEIIKQGIVRIKDDAVYSPSIDKIAKAKYQFETGTSKVLQKKVIENINNQSRVDLI